MIVIRNTSVYIEYNGELTMVGKFEVCGGKMCFAANYILPEFPLEADELRSILDELDQLNSEQDQFEFKRFRREVGDK